MSKLIDTLAPNRAYGLIKQRDDDRDLKVSFEKVIDIPDKVDLRDKCPPIWNQNQLGACSAHAGVAAKMILDNNKDAMLSRLYLYYKERELEGTISEDSGAEMRDVCKVLNQIGVCEESLCPYIEANFAKTPTDEMNNNANQYKINSYKSLSGVDEIKQYIAINQMPVLLGMDVYESFESDTTTKTGIVPMPDPTKERLLGGHAILLCGYIDDGNSVRQSRNYKMKATANKSGGFFSWLIDLIFGSKTTTPISDTNNDGYFILRNSWGILAGDQGYYYLPYDYVNKGYGFDAWTISM